MGREENTPTWVQWPINDRFLPTTAHVWQREVQTTVNRLLQRLCVKTKKKVQRISHSRSEKCGVGEGLTFTPLNWSARTEIPVTYDLCSPVIASSPSATVRLHAFLYL